VKLPIEIVEGARPGQPVLFRYHGVITTPIGARTVELKEVLPMHAERAVVDLINIARQLADERDRLAAENEALREQLEGVTTPCH